MIKKFIKHIVYGKKSSSKEYIDYLKKRGAVIGEGVYFFSPETTNIDSVRYNYITIGSYTKITSGFTMLAHDYSSSVLIGKYNDILLPGGADTKIGSNCFIGMNVTVLMGVQIGDNVIIGNGAIVTADIPSNTVVAGVPARVISSLDEYYKKRKVSYLNDAVRNIKHFYNKNGRYPEANECGGFAELYLSRDEANYEKFVKSYLALGNDETAVRSAFFGSEPYFSSYDEFIEYCIKN